MRMAQSQGIMSTTIESTSESWARVGLLVVFQLVRNRQRVIWNERQLQRLTDEEIITLDRILSIPINEVPRRFKFEIFTTDIEHSYEAKRDTLMKLMEMTMQAQPLLLQLSQQVFGPQGMQLKQIAPDAWEQQLEIYVGSVNLLKQSFVFADFDDTEDYLQDVSKWDKLIQVLREANAKQLQSMDAMRNQGGMNGPGMGSGAPGAAGGSAVPGMAQIPGSTGGIVPGGNGGAGVPPQNAGAGPGLGGQ